MPPTQQNGPPKKGILYSIEASLAKVENAFIYLVSLICFGMMIWLVASIISRSFFGTPWKGVYEFAGLLMISVVFMPLSYSQRYKEHVNVDFLVKKLKKRPFFLVQLIISLISLILFIIVGIEIAMNTLHLWEVGENEPAAFSVQLWPFYLSAVLGAFMLATRFIIELFNYAKELLGAKEGKKTWV